MGRVNNPNLAHVPNTNPWPNGQMPNMPTGAWVTGPGGFPTQLQYPNYNPGSLPVGLNPGAQSYGRMNPDEQDQYLGYQQARTGSTPNKTKWNLWNTAPPSGRNMGVQYRR